MEGSHHVPNSCSLGIFLNEECHTQQTDLTQLNVANKQLLSWRCGIKAADATSICVHHEETLLKRYSLNQKKCCDPFKQHSKPIKATLREITLENAQSAQKYGISLHPGKKLCSSCRKSIYEVEKTATESPLTNENSSSDEIEQMESELSRKETLNTSLEGFKVSPVNLHSVPSHSRTSLGVKKLKQVKRKLSETYSTIQEDLASVLDVEEENLTLEQNPVEKELQKKANDFDELIGLMKEKLQVSSRSKKVQILTLSPPSWSVEKTAETFEVSKYLVRTARKLKAERGILEQPCKKRGKEIPNNVIELVKLFYCDDDYSRLMPGQKDYVSVSKNVHVQKRLLLCNLKELFSAFKQKHPDVKLGFSKFCSLRPKQCVTVSSTGTHSVCVCTIHQNVSLMLGAIGLEKDTRRLTEMIVCDRENKDCMIHRCGNCPGTEVLKKYLEDYLNEQEDNECDADAEENHIVFKQWTNTDRSDLITQTLPVDEFITILIEKLDNLTTHSFIAKAQSRYLRDAKENLTEDEVIALVDFAENYGFTIQDEVQGFHWNKKQCTVHPVVLYYKQDGQLKETSLCVISDDLTHDTDMVYEIIAQTVSFIKEKLPAIHKLHFFSDGCAGQYKNRKNFLNLCYHQADFGLKCKWSFFATSHGKSPCDGVGGTVKRLTARASLQRPTSNQILTAREMFQFCQKEITGVKFLFISKDDMIATRFKLAERYVNAKTIPGTRSFHHFYPKTSECIVAKRFSADEKIAIEFNFFQVQEPAVDVHAADFVLCMYDSKYWIGLVSEVNFEEKDVKVKFMHPNYPSRSFKWPLRDDECWVPETNILCILKPLNTATGRQYHLDKDDTAKVSKLIHT